ncbi:MAG: hypothetical protein AAF488_16390, partial [Planctomycetota bacterium]
MSPFIVLVLGVLFIILAIAVFKIHPFFALILAAVLVGVLSPKPLLKNPSTTVRVWNTENALASHPSGSAGRNMDLAYSGDGSKFAAVSRDGDIRLWVSGTGAEPTKWSLGGVLRAVALDTAGSRIAVAGEGGEIRILDASQTAEPKVLHTLKGHGDRIHELIAAGDVLASCSDDGAVRVWNFATGAETASIEVGSPVRAIALSRDGATLLAGTATGSVVTYTVATKAEAGKLEFGASVESVAISPDGSRVAAGLADGSLAVSVNGAEAVKVGADDSKVVSVAFSPDGAEIASAAQYRKNQGEKLIKIWAVNGFAAASTPKATFTGFNGPATRAVYRPGSNELAASYVDQLNPKPQASLALEAAGTFLGSLAGKISIVIALAAVVGQALMESGAADKITRRLLGFLGEKRANFALLGSGYVLSVPVFFDTVFFLLVPLARALRMRTGKNFLLYVMAICAGGAVTHSLVPPTPGPLIMVEFLDLDLGQAILGGFLLGLPVAIFGGIILPMWLTKFVDPPLRETAGSSNEELEAIVSKDEKELPGFLVSIAPVALPVLLITAHSVLGAFQRISPVPESYESILTITSFFGDKLFALGLGTAIALWVLVRQKGYSLGDLMKSLEPALGAAGTIILITCAG